MMQTSNDEKTLDKIKIEKEVVDVDVDVEEKYEIDLKHDFSHLENNSKATIQEKENFGNEEDSAQPLQIKETKEAEIIETISDFIQ